MAKKSPYDTITSYRKRQRYGPILISGLSLVLISSGLFFLWLWLSGRTLDNLALFNPSTPAPIPTMRPTVTLVPTRTLISPEDAISNGQSSPTALVPFQITVQPGDTLVGLAELYNLDPEFGVLLIMSYNNWYPGRFLQLDETITIPHPDATLFTPTPLPSDLPPGTEILYLILPGDTIASIAEEFFSTVDAIIEANDLDEPDQIEVGQYLLIPIDLITPTVAPLVSITPETSGTLTPSPTLPPTATPSP
jgi:LysM repeat protein